MILLVGDRTNGTSAIIGIVQTEQQALTVMRGMQTSSYWREIYFLPLDSEPIRNMAKLHTTNFLLENPMKSEQELADDELLAALQSIGKTQS